MYHHYFPPETIALREELVHHPDLMVILAVQTDADFYVHLAEVAAYCGVALNGDFTQPEILRICDVCTKILQSKRAIHLHH